MTRLSSGRKKVNMAKAIRVARAESIFQRELSNIFLFKSKDNRLKDIIITSVKVSKDLKIVKVKYILPKDTDRQEVSNALERAKGYLKSHIAQNISIREIPELYFYYDEGLDHAEKINQIITDYRKEHPQDDEEQGDTETNE